MTSTRTSRASLEALGEETEHQEVPVITYNTTINLTNHQDNKEPQTEPEGARIELQHKAEAIRRSCLNYPDFAVICAFLQRFHKELGLELPNFKQLQEWITSTKEIPSQLRDLHIKLLRKTRKTVHEKSWEMAVSKFCFTYSAQDAWEIERFGYKNIGVSTKLRILRELLESQFERNTTFRSKIVALNAENLRSEPIGRDRLGYTYWLTRDNDCNIQIYQEHLDEEIWRVVATNREEFVALIERLKNNEKILPLEHENRQDEEEDDEDESSQSGSVTAGSEALKQLADEHSNDETDEEPEKPLEPIEDQPDEEAELYKCVPKIPNLRIKLNSSGTMDTILDNGLTSIDATCELPLKLLKSPSIEDQEEDEEQVVEGEVGDKREEFVSRSATYSASDEVNPEIENEDQNATAKRILSDVEDNQGTKKLCLEKADLKETTANIVDENQPNNEAKNKNIDDSLEEVDDSSSTGGEMEVEGVVGEAIEEEVQHINGDGDGYSCDVGNLWHLNLFDDEEQAEALQIVGEAIMDDPFHVFGDGFGHDCQVGNRKEASEVLMPAPIENVLAKVGSSLHEDCVMDNEAMIRREGRKNDGEQVSNDDDVDHNRHSDDKDFTVSLQDQHQREKSKLITVINNPENDKQGEMSVQKKEEEIKDGDDGGGEVKNITETKQESQKPTLSNFTKKMLALETVKKELRASKQKSLQKIQETRTLNSTATINRRKRRLDQFTATPARSYSNSESELDLNSESNINSTILMDDNTSGREDVGGKRIKIRPKRANNELRKKIEAQKVAQKMDENTSSSSSSGEEQTNSLVKRSTKHHQQVMKVFPAGSTNNGMISQKVDPILKVNEHSLEIAAEKEEDNATTTSSVLSYPKTAGKHVLSECGVEVETKKLAMPDSETTVELSNNAKDNISNAIIQPLKKNLLAQVRQETNSDVELNQNSKGSSEKTIAITTRNRSQNDVIIKESVKYACKKETISVKEEKTNIIEKSLTNSLAQGEGKIMTKQVDKNEGQCEEIKMVKEEGGNEMIEKGEGRQNATEEGDGKKKKALAEAEENEVNSCKSPVTRRSGRLNGGNIYFSKSVDYKKLRNNVKTLVAIVKKSKDELDTIELTVSATTEKEEKKKVSLEVSPDECKEEEGKKVKEQYSIMENIHNDEEKMEKSRENEEAAAMKVDEKVNVKSSAPPIKATGRGVRKKRDVDASNIIESTTSGTPVRQSRRIALQKIREEAERRKLEEIALRSMKEELKKKKKAEEKCHDPTIPEPSEEEDDEVAYSSSENNQHKSKKKAHKKKLPGKNGGWSSDSEEPEDVEDEEEYEEPPHYETDCGSPLFKSDHEFSPESDLENDVDQIPLKRARTARKEDAPDDGMEEGYEEEACQNCGKCDHPEWILLCDKCDKGYHCSCLSPVLFYIPEGDWFCPPCQQAQLIEALNIQLRKYDEFVHLKVEEEAEAEAERIRQKQLEQSLRQKVEGHEDEEEEEGEEHPYSDDSEESQKPRKPALTRADRHKRRNKNQKPKQTQKQNQKKKRRRKNEYPREQRRNSSYSSSSFASYSAVASATGSASLSSSSLSNYSESDNEPIYKLRKRRQINVSYRLNEYDELINSALKKEMDEAAGAGNLGRGKDISTIIEADREEKARQNRMASSGRRVNDPHGVDTDILLKNEYNDHDDHDGNQDEDENVIRGTLMGTKDAAFNSSNNVSFENHEVSGSTLKSRNHKHNSKKKVRKLTTLDISSEEDNESDEDFKESSFEDDEDDEDTSMSTTSGSDSSLEKYKNHRNKSSHKRVRKSIRQTLRSCRRSKHFVVDESDENENDDDDEEEEDVVNVKFHKKRKQHRDDSDYTESEINDDDGSELSENIDSADLCDDTTSEESDSAWQPSRMRKSKSGGQVGKGKSKNTRKSFVVKKRIPGKKRMKIESSDDDDVDVSNDDNYDNKDDMDDRSKNDAKTKDNHGQPTRTMEGLHKRVVNSNIKNIKIDHELNLQSGKSLKDLPLKPNLHINFVDNGRLSKDENQDAAGDGIEQNNDVDGSLSESGDSARRTRGRRYAYIEDFDEESSEDGIKPGVHRPDTPPEEREQFIKRQLEIKRMLAEKSSDDTKVEDDIKKLTPARQATLESLSTVPISVIRQAKALDVDYLQRKGGSLNDGENDVDEEVNDFDDSDLPDDLPDDMDEDAIARMVEEDEEFGAAAAARELPAPDEILKSYSKPNKPKDLYEKVSSAPIQQSSSRLVLTGAAGPITSAQHELITPPTLIPIINSLANSIPQGVGGIPLNLGVHESLIQKKFPMGQEGPTALHIGTDPALTHIVGHQAPLPPSPLSSHPSQIINKNEICPPIQKPFRKSPITVQLLQTALSTPLSQPLQRNYPGMSLKKNSQDSSPLPQVLPVNIVGSLVSNTTADLYDNMKLNRKSPVPEILKKPVEMMQEDSSPLAAGDLSKPRGRRKKITPLRDSYQKQKTAAAAAASINTPNHPNTDGNVVITAPPSYPEGVVPSKSNSAPVRAATNQKIIPGQSIVTSTSLAHLLPANNAHKSLNTTTEGFYGSTLNHPPFGNIRYHSSVAQTILGAPAAVLPPPTPAGSTQAPHLGLRPPSRYGPPPLLRGTATTAATSTILNAINSNIRLPFASGAAAVGLQDTVRDNQLSPYLGSMLSARHAALQLNSYRQLYGNPSLTPRMSVTVPGVTERNIRSCTSVAHATDYHLRGPHVSFPPPYGYYPSTSSLSTQQVPHSISLVTPAAHLLMKPAPSGVTIPPGSTKSLTSSLASTSGGSIMLTIATQSMATLKTSSSLASITASATTGYTSVITSAPLQSLPMTLNATGGATTMPEVGSNSNIATTATTETSTTILPIVASVSKETSATSIEVRQDSGIPAAIAMDGRRNPATVPASMKTTIIIKNDNGEEEQNNTGSIATAEDVECTTAESLSLIQTTSSVEEDNNGPASEFSGLVSYFSSQHDDYNT